MIFVGNYGQLKPNYPKLRLNRSFKLMDRLREGLRYYRYDYHPGQTHAHWILRYIHDIGGETHPSRYKARCTGHRRDAVPGAMLSGLAPVCYLASLFGKQGCFADEYLWPCRRLWVWRASFSYSKASVLRANISSGLTFCGRIFWSWANWITASIALRLRARP